MNLENITKTYSLKNEQITALNNLTYKFEKGKLYAIMGHSGSGKSTLIKIMGLIEKPTSGKYTINNTDISTLNDKELSLLRMKHIGFIFQEFYLNDHLKAYENVILPMLINPEIPKNDRQKRALSLLELVGLQERINHFPKELSGGEKQRIAMARALANDPEIILADEPTGNLDEENETIIFNYLKELSEKGKCVIVVSHSDNVKKYADEILIIQKGKLETHENI